MNLANSKSDPDVSARSSDSAQSQINDGSVQVPDVPLLVVSILVGVLTAGLLCVWLTMTDPALLPPIPNLIHFLLSNTGLLLTSMMSFAMVAGFVFMVGLWFTIIPSRRRLRKQWVIIQNQLGLLQARSERATTIHNMPNTPTSMDADVAAQDADNKMTSGMDDAYDHADSASTPTDSSDPSIDPENPPTDEPAPLDGPTSSADEPSTESRPDPSAQKLEDDANVENMRVACHQVHPWLGHRVIAVVEVLNNQGPETALQHNNDIGTQQESAVATALLPAQLCEWALPLFGFLGTVWGLHKAIPPLKTGIETLMKAMRQTEQNGSELRDKGMAMFGKGFDGLVLAFDSTLIGLVGVLVVGAMLYITRRRALLALTDIHHFVESTIRRYPAVRDNSRDVLERMEANLHQGLFAQTNGKAIPTLLAITNAVQRGLLFHPPGSNEPTSQIDRATVLLLKHLSQKGQLTQKMINRAVQELREQLKQNTNLLSRVGGAQIRESRFQSFLQMRSIAPDLRHIRHEVARLRTMVGGGDPGEVQTEDESYILDPFMRTVMSLPESVQIDSIALSPDAAYACVATTDAKQHLHTVQEIAISWGSDSGQFKGQIHATETQQSPDQAMLGVSYGLQGHQLLTARQGLVRAFRSNEDGGFFQEGQYPLEGSLIPNPFVWLQDLPNQPLVARWHENFFALTTLEGRNAGLSQEVQRGLTSLGKTGMRNILHREDGNLIVAANETDIVVAGITQGRKFELVATKQMDEIIKAIDISEYGRFVIYALQDGSIHLWRFDEQGSEAHQTLADPHGTLGVEDLHLNSAGDAVAMLMGRQIALLDLRRPGRPRLFDTGGAWIKQICHSPDRSYLLAGTGDNQLLLFSFGSRI